MNRRFVVRPEARLEVLEAANWYADRSAGLGGEFVRVVDAALAQIERSPLRLPVVDPPVRRAVLRRFPYTVMFTADDDEIVVLSVFHVRRDPRDWKDKI